MKINRHITLCLLFVLTFSCKKDNNDNNNTENEIKFSDTVVKRSNSKLAFNITFKSPFIDKKGKRNWRKDDIDRFTEAVDRWLEVIKGIQGINGECVINLEVQGLYKSEGKILKGGAAGVEYFKKIKEEVYLPISSYMVLEGGMFSEDHVEVIERELYYTILHELGHVLGVGTQFRLVNYHGYIIMGDYEKNMSKPDDIRNWLSEAPVGSTGKPGLIYKKPKGVEKFNKVFSSNFGFVPITKDGGHLFLGNSWILADGTKVPEITEIMSSGKNITSISLGILEDFGWVVDYSKADPYKKTNNK